MSLWDLRQWWESRIPAWLPFAMVAGIIIFILAADWFESRKIKKGFRDSSAVKK